MSNFSSTTTTTTVKMCSLKNGNHLMARIPESLPKSNKLAKCSVARQSSGKLLSWAFVVTRTNKNKQIGGKFHCCNFTSRNDNALFSLWAIKSFSSQEFSKCFFFVSVFSVVSSQSRCFEHKMVIHNINANMNWSHLQRLIFHTTGGLYFLLASPAFRRRETK